MHIDASGISLSAIHMQPREGNHDHPIYFASRKISIAKQNYTTPKCEALPMAYSLQKFQHYLVGGNFKFFTDHSTLMYLVNKPILEARIY